MVDRILGIILVRIPFSAKVEKSDFSAQQPLAVGSVRAADGEQVHFHAACVYSAYISNMQIFPCIVFIPLFPYINIFL